MVPHASRAMTRQTLRFPHGGDGIDRKRQIVLGVLAGRPTGAALVIDECADASRGKLTLQRVVVAR